METYHIWMIAGSSVTLISGGLGWLLSMIKSQERRIRDLELEVAVIKAIQEERSR